MNRAIRIDTRCAEIDLDGFPCRANLWDDGTCTNRHEHWQDDDSTLIGAILLAAQDPTSGWSRFRPAVRITPYV